MHTSNKVNGQSRKDFPTWQPKQIEVFLLIDEDGDYVISNDKDELKELYEDTVGDLDGTRCCRIVRVVLDVPLPKTAVIRATVPVAAGEVVATVG